MSISKSFFHLKEEKVNPHNANTASLQDNVILGRLCMPSGSVVRTRNLPIFQFTPFRGVQLGAKICQLFFSNPNSVRFLKPKYIGNG